MKSIGPLATTVVCAALTLPCLAAAQTALAIPSITTPRGEAFWRPVDRYTFREDKLATKDVYRKPITL
jgi:hypothetical protein